MNTMIAGYKKIFLGICLLVLLPCVSVARQKSKSDSRAGQTEVRADISFIRGDYDRAMKLYAQASEKYGATDSMGLNLKLKMARLYILLQSPMEAIECYDVVRQASDTMLTVNDVCYYIDALRQIGRDQQAEIVARQYAFLSPYSNNQRYLNTLYSLSDLQRYYGKGDSDYSVKLKERSTSIPEYWLGKWDGDVFYAVSNSRLQDPAKIYYHQTQYYFSSESNKPSPFRSIPRELQSGPVAFSNDNTLMIATGISYPESDKIEDITGANSIFSTQLYYSAIDSNRGGWRAFQPLFEHQQGHNFAHPAFYGDGGTIVFSSDRPGGYGGMDLYVAEWDGVAGEWGVPVNMGPVVNTEGDEIFPRITDDGLYFASNGLEGYGGYDIYRVNFVQDKVTPGSLYHYPHPINSVNNDFGIFLDGNKGYFVSDRRGFSGKDDIYTFDASLSPLNNKSAVGVSDEYSAMTGNFNLIRGLKASNNRTTEVDLNLTPTYYTAKDGELLLSVYFNFNNSILDAEAMNAIRSILDTPEFENAEELYVLGYADEFGTAQYNFRLSRRRAEAVARAMAGYSGKQLPTLIIEGRGQLTLSPEEYSEAAQQMVGNRNTIPDGYEIKQVDQRRPLSFGERVKINRKVRRVDIVVKKKKN